MAARKRKRDEAPPERTAPADCAVVGLGASAGGVEALQQFFDAMPADSPLAFVVIVHLAPARESRMAEVLARHTAMKVEEVHASTPVAPGHVYIIPPDKYLGIKEGVLHLSDPSESRFLRIPIDFFFRSLAEDRKEKAIGVVLSGTGSEGALGLKEIHARGGMTVVQDPATAIHPGMPQSALATAIVDLVLPVGQIPAELVRYALHPYVRGSPAVAPENAPEKEQDTLSRILSLVLARTRRDFRRYKKNTLRRRIERRMGLNHVAELADYLALLRQNPAEVNHLFKDLLICVTNFFREPAAWETLAADFLKPLIQAKEADGPLRVWVPGCATGEEPYSLAILLHEQLVLAQKSSSVQVFATDLNEDALNVARAGLYPLSIAADVTPERLRRFFIKLDDRAYQIAKPVRESISFAIQDLTGDPPFSRLDLIVCRNLLIYLEAEVQKRVIGLFHFALMPGGGLFLGTSENVNRQDELFESISKKWHIYRRIGAGRRGPIQIPFAGAAEQGAGVGGPASRVSRKNEPGRLPGLAERARQLLLEQFAPAAVLIDRRYQILYLHGPTDRYLSLPAGEPTLDLPSMVPKALGSKLGAALHRVVRENRPVVIGGIRVPRDGGGRSVRLTVRPVEPASGVRGQGSPSEQGSGVRGQGSASEQGSGVRGQGSASEQGSGVRGQGSAEKERGVDSSLSPEPWPVAPVLLVTFEDEVAPEPPAAAPAADGEAVVRQLESELCTTREDLQHSIEEAETSTEELRASNEEIMSINEELQSSNEEMETAKEELQSLNEELSTLNSQLKDKIEELESANNDLANLLVCTDIATIFLDAHFAIKRFTPAATRLVNLIPSDVGRPLSDIASRFTDTDLLADARTVLDRLTPLEKEIYVPAVPHSPQASGMPAAAAGRWYVRRILPYRTQDNRIEGVAVTFLDVSSIHQAMEQTRTRARQQAALAELGLHALLGAAPQTLLDEAVRSVADTLGVTPRLPAVSSQLSFATDSGQLNADQIIHVLAGDPRDRRPFTDSEANFLQTMANVLAQALDRQRREQELRALNATLEQRVTERTGLMKLLQDVTVAANEAETVEQALRFALHRVCEYNGWQLGHVCEVTPDGQALIPTDLWFSRGDRSFENFRRLTMQMREPLQIAEQTPAVSSQSAI